MACSLIEFEGEGVTATTSTDTSAATLSQHLPPHLHQRVARPRNDHLASIPT